jgi:hypothetical protein
MTTEQSLKEKYWIFRHPVLFFTMFNLVVLLVVNGLASWVYCKWDKYSGEALNSRRSFSFHHTKVPMSTWTEHWGPLSFQMYTNSLGFKDSKSRKIPLMSERRRVLLIGDSFTEGMGIPQDKTFAGITDNRLKGVEVLNAGVSSYSPSVYRNKLRYLLDEVGLQFNEVVVYIDISDIQDEAICYELDSKGRVVDAGTGELSVASIRFWSFLKSYSPIGYFIADTIKEKFGKLPEAAAEAKRLCGRNNYRSGWTFDKHIYKDYGKRGLDISRDRMNDILKMLKERNISLTVAVYPWPVQIYRGDLDSRQATFWSDWTSKNGVGFINYFPEFIGKGLDRKETIDRFFIPGDSHWNEEGHKKIAEKLIAYLGSKDSGRRAD